MANKKVQKAGKAAQAARSNPYVQRLIEDEDLRQNIVQAYESARDAYGRLSNGKSPAKQIFEDKKLQKHIKETAGNVRDVQRRLDEAPKKQKARRRPRPPRPARHRRRGGRARALRGPAQEGARRAVRRRGGVRVHLDDLVLVVEPPAPSAELRHPGLHPEHPLFCEGAPRAPSFLPSTVSRVAAYDARLGRERRDLDPDPPRGARAAEPHVVVARSFSVRVVVLPRGSARMRTVALWPLACPASSRSVQRPWRLRALLANRTAATRGRAGVRSCGSATCRRASAWCRRSTERSPRSPSPSRVGPRGSGCRDRRRRPAASWRRACATAGRSACRRAARRSPRSRTAPSHVAGGSRTCTPAPGSASVAELERAAPAAVGNPRGRSWKPLRAVPSTTAGPPGACAAPTSSASGSEIGSRW